MERDIFDSYKRLRLKGLSEREAVEYLESKLRVKLPEHIKDMIRSEKC